MQTQFALAAMFVAATASASAGRHLAKAQYYRWYQLYERPMNKKRIANQMDILADEIAIKSAAGQMKGKSNYPPRLKAYKGWKNAHHVEKVEVTEGAGGKAAIKALIRYQNIKPDGSRASYKVAYDMDLVKNSGQLLPVFTRIDLKPVEQTKEKFVDSYPENRVKSLIHYWTGNVEQLDGNAEPFKEILADSFEINFPSGKITSLNRLKTWLEVTTFRVKSSSHTLKNLKVKDLGNDRFDVKFDFDWQGVSKMGKNMAMTTHHHWLVKDNPDERFARIEKIVAKM